MKIMIAALALAVAVVSPALAQNRYNNQQRYQAYQQGWDYSLPNRRAHSPNPQWDVYRNDGTYAGTDPDPAVRRNLYRDNPHTDE